MKTSLNLLLLAVLATSISLFTAPLSHADNIPHNTAAGSEYAFTDTCQVKTDVSFDFPDSLYKKIKAVIEDKMAEGIEGGGKITWENSPAADEYYLIILRKGKISLKYKGVLCEDKIIWENIEACKAEIKKLVEAK